MDQRDYDNLEPFWTKDWHDFVTAWVLTLGMFEGTLMGILCAPRYPGLRGISVALSVLFGILVAANACLTYGSLSRYWLHRLDRFEPSEVEPAPVRQKGLWNPWKILQESRDV